MRSFEIAKMLYKNMSNYYKFFNKLIRNKIIVTTETAKRNIFE